MIDRLWLLRKSNEDIDEYLEDDLLDDYSGLEILSKSLELNKDEIHSIESYEWNAQHYAEKIDNYLLLPTGLLNFNYPSLKKKSKKRERPIEILRSTYQSSVHLVAMPEGYNLFEEYKSVEIESDFGLYSKKVETVGEDELKIIRKLTIYKGVYENTRFKAFRSFFNKISKYETEQITISHE